jgi:hypothetical protein
MKPGETPSVRWEGRRFDPLPNRIAFRRELHGTTAGNGAYENGAAGSPAHLRTTADEAT